MLSDQDLKSAVELNIISQDQHQKLRDLALSTHSKLESKVTLDQNDDEGFRFISGFNDIFFAVGIGFLLYGYSLWQAAGSNLYYGILAVLGWVLAEIFAKLMKRTLPSMIAASIFVFSVLQLAHLYLFGTSLGNAHYGEINTIIQKAIALGTSGMVAGILFYLRFRLPFSLFLIGTNFLGIAITVTAWLLQENYYQFAIPLLFASGMMLFLVAMAFDSADTQRQTRLSDNGFWLHLLAAPFMVHSIMWQSAIWVIGRPDGLDWKSLSNIAPILVGVVVAVFVPVVISALIVDRKAMLVSMLIYITSATTWLVASQSSIAQSAAIAPIMIGSAIIGLGIGWRSLRRMVFGILPLTFIKPYVPTIKT